MPRVVVQLALSLPRITALGVLGVVPKVGLTVALAIVVAHHVQLVAVAAIVPGLVHGRYRGPRGVDLVRALSPGCARCAAPISVPSSDSSFSILHRMIEGWLRSR